MAIPTNLWQKTNTGFKGAREDLLDKIFNTSPTETPITSAMGRVTATSDFHEWQTDALASADPANKMVEGDDATLAVITGTSRLGNHLQTFNGSVGVSRRAQIIKKAGRATEMAYQKGKKMLELKRNIEAMVLSPTQVAIAATVSVAGQSGGLGVQCVSNPLHNGAGATAAWTSGAPTAAITAGTNRTFTKALLDTACQNVFTTSGQFSEMLVVSPNHKGLFSAFASVAQNRIEVKGNKNAQATIVGGAEVYLSDFGGISVVPHYLLAASDTAYLLNTDYLDLAFLDGFVTSDLAKTGDSERILITADACLAVRAPTSQAKITNLTP
jgi:hypothetical protein